ncbi:MAG: UbiD family decarboxylase, partial [Dehalococcoidia bacterium]|nr:UbiD family decarboxylase [Dehalococcoidia bacterium]
MAYYKDLREYIQTLEAAQKLVRISKQINKDTELHPLVRWQFRGLPEDQRKAFLFENVVDVKGKSYTIPVLVACHAASRAIYALGMKCREEEINEKWTQAQLHPVNPEMVDNGPVHDVVLTGDALLKAGGLGMLPVPISTPGFDNAPYFTSACWVTKDPETGIRNVGVYRNQIKSPTRLGVSSSPPKDLWTHWEKCHDRGIPLQAAAVIGAPPNVGFTAVGKVPYGADEFSVSGGIAGEPLKLVKCKTVDLEVPATAEIVVEGIIPTDSLEREAPFGEYTGYMGGEMINPYMNVTAITHRKDPIFVAFLSQFPPSESSKLRQISTEALYYKHLKYDCSLPNIQEVAFHESSGSWQYCVIKMKKTHPAQPWKALYAAANLDNHIGKFIIIVDDDIDPRDADSVNWALSFRVQPHRDTHVTYGKIPALDHSSAPPDHPERRYPLPRGCSSMLIDATRKWGYPPVSLPKKEFMERAKELWDELGLPALSPKVPWHGYSLGYWTKENEEEAELA